MLSTQIFSQNWIIIAKKTLSLQADPRRLETMSLTHFVNNQNEKHGNI